MEQLNKKIQNALPDLPPPNAPDYEIRLLRNNQMIAERKFRVSFQIKELEKRLLDLKTNKDSRRSKMLSKPLNKEQIDNVIFSFNLPDEMYIQMLEQLYKLKNDESYTEKTRGELLLEKQTIIENLLAGLETPNTWKLNERTV